MYPKYKLEKYLIDNKDFLLKLFGLCDWRIEFHIYSSVAKNAKKLQIKGYKHQAGVSMSSALSKSADVILFYDQLVNEKDAIGTIFHELLHVKLAKLTEYVTIRSDLSHIEEEKIVQCLEHMMISLYFKNKKR